MASGIKPPSNKGPTGPWTAPKDPSAKSARTAPRPPLHDGPRHAEADKLDRQQAKIKRSAKVAPAPPPRVASQKATIGRKAAPPAAPPTAAESYVMVKVANANLRKLTAKADRVTAQLEKTQNVADYAEQFAQHAAYEAKGYEAALQLFNACWALVNATPDIDYARRAMKAVALTHKTLRTHKAFADSWIGLLTKHVERPNSPSSEAEVKNLFTQSEFAMSSTARQAADVRSLYMHQLKTLTKQQEFLSRALRRIDPLAAATLKATKA